MTTNKTNPKRRSKPGKPRTTKSTLKRRQKPTKKSSVPAVADERLQKVAADAGLASRRGFEAAIKAGHVRVNGQPAVLGQRVGQRDRVVFDRRVFRVEARSSEAGKVLLYHKPEGELTTRKDARGRPTVFDRLPRLKGERWVAIGRLDINSTGLLLLTTDGELAHAMMHPSHQVDKEYLCRVHGRVSPEIVQRLRQGVELDDGPAKFADIVVGEGGASNCWYTVAVMEGRHRLVRRLWESQGLQVNRLKRVRHGAVFLPDNLRQGHWVALQPSDVRTLRQDVGLAEDRAALTLRPAK